jgi:putative endonuclease
MSHHKYRINMQCFCGKTIGYLQVKDDWFIYILRCADRTLYTGIAKNIEKRLAEHNSGGKAAAKYTRSRGPVSLVYTEKAGSHSVAAKREYEIKQMSKKSKELLISNSNNKLH